MKLSQILMVWPKRRPNGYIWSGKHQMVRMVKQSDVDQMNKKIKLEQANTYICLNPYITPEQERVAMKAREKQSLRDDKILFKLRKAKAEATVMAPTYVEDNIKHMAHNVSWGKQQGH